MTKSEVLMLRNDWQLDLFRRRDDSSDIEPPERAAKIGFIQKIWLAGAGRRRWRGVVARRLRRFLW